MKRYPVIIVLLALALRLYGQLANGSIAPDFNVQDINGQYRHLYEWLDQDKIVLLEVSATWCPPCWAYHNSHAMENFYTMHGPAGDNKARVFFVEGDPQTNVACLYGPGGCNNYTTGDWVTGTTYPVIDNADIADSFHTTYYPTIFVICPNRKTYTVGQLSAIDLWDKAALCPVKNGNNNAGIFEYDAGSPLREICDTLMLGPHFTLTNLGLNALNAAEISLEWKGGIIQTIQWTGNLPLYGEAKISFNQYPVTGDGGILKTTIKTINGGIPDEDFSNNVRNDSFSGSETFTKPKVLLKIRTDSYGAETYWELRDATGNVLDHGGNENVGPNGGGSLIDANPGPGAYGNGVLIKDTLTLPGAGCYSLHFVDAYGDGICCGFGNGYYKLYNIDNPVVPIITGGEFGAYDDRAFGALGLPTATNDLPAAPDPDLFPNPAASLVHIYFDLASEARVSGWIANSMGQLVRQIEATDAAPGEQHWEISVENLPNGLYFFQLTVNNQHVSKKFVVQK
jgi:hypothetical protein